MGIKSKRDPVTQEQLEAVRRMQTAYTNLSVRLPKYTEDKDFSGDQVCICTKKYAGVFLDWMKKYEPEWFSGFDDVYTFLCEIDRAVYLVFTAIGALFREDRWEKEESLPLMAKIERAGELLEYGEKLQALFTRWICKAADKNSNKKERLDKVENLIEGQLMLIDLIRNDMVNSPYDSASERKELIKLIDLCTKEILQNHQKTIEAYKESI